MTLVIVLFFFFDKNDWRGNFHEDGCLKTSYTWFRFSWKIFFLDKLWLVGIIKKKIILNTILIQKKYKIISDQNWLPGIQKKKISEQNFDLKNFKNISDQILIPKNFYKNSEQNFDLKNFQKIFSLNFAL